MATTVARLQAVLSADTGQFDKRMDRSEGRMQKVGKAATVMSGVLLGGLAVGLKKSVDAAMESEKAQSRLQQAMGSAGVSMAKYGKTIEANIQKTSRLAALDDEDLSDAFAKLLRATGDVTRATQGMNLAADIARARNISLEAATKMVERAQIGNAAAFSRVGIAIVKSSDNLKAAKAMIDTWRDSSGKLTEAEDRKAKALLDSARELDKQASAAKAFAEAQERFSGTARRYGETTAGAQERFRVALENLQEKIGSAVLPILRDFIARLTALLGWVERNQTAAKIIVGTLAGLAAGVLVVNAGMAAYRAAVAAATAVQIVFNAALTANPIGVTVVAIAALAAGIVIAYKKSETFRAIVDGLWGKLKDLGGWMREKFPAAKEAFMKVLDPIVAAFELWWKAISKVVDSVKWLIENASKLGKLLPDFGGAAGTGGRFGARGDAHVTGGFNLMGASPVMAPFAAAAAAHGLTVSSGLRPGARTKHGTLSDHALGKALDLAGPASAMGAFFKSLLGNSAVKQAFYDPLGSIFAGAWSSYREGGHSDHVHVATYDQGGILKPGLTMAYNGTGRNEYVTRGQPILLQLDLNGQQFVRAVFDDFKGENIRRGRLGRGL